MAAEQAKYLWRIEGDRDLPAQSTIQSYVNDQGFASCKFLFDKRRFSVMNEALFLRFGDLYVLEIHRRARDCFLRYFFRGSVIRTDLA